MLAFVLHLGARLYATSMMRLCPIPSPALHHGTKLRLNLAHQLHLQPDPLLHALHLWRWVPARVLGVAAPELATLGNSKYSKNYRIVNDI